MAKRKRGNSEGSIYHMSDGRWRAAVMIGWKLAPDGKRIPLRKTFTAATRHEVSDLLTDALKNRKDGIPLVNEKQNVSKFLTHWLEQVAKPRVRPKTYRTYSDLVKLHIAPAIGDIPVGKLSPQNVREFLNAKLAAGLSPRTVKHLLVTLRGALAVAVKDGQLPRNVAAHVDPPHVPDSEVQVFNPEQAREFLKAVRGSRLEAAYTAAVAVGMRQGEILGLRWTDLDLETGKLFVRVALQRVDKKLVQVQPKSRKSRRPIQLPAVCVTAFARRKADQDLERKWAGSQWQESEYVFTTRIGTPMDARDLLRDYYAITRPKTKEGKPVKLPFPPIKFHALRHSAATILLAQGVHQRYIADLLGHSQVSFTLQTYAHVLEELQKQTADKMDEILAPVPVATSVATKAASTRPS